MKFRKRECRAGKGYVVVDKEVIHVLKLSEQKQPLKYFFLTTWIKKWVDTLSEETFNNVQKSFDPLYISKVYTFCAWI